MSKGYCPYFGNYPKEYNRAVHGPYYPWVNYGPRDPVPFSQVKLGDLTSYIARRNKTPQAIIAQLSRTVHKWQHSWLGSRYGSPSKATLQFTTIYSFVCMLGLLKMLREHRNHKYHW